MIAIRPNVLEMKNIKKRFGGVKALDGVNLEIQEGEVHALLGENGAGKSTLMKILGGSYRMDEGEMYMDGKKIQISSPIQAQRQGIAVIYQEQALVNCLTVADNILLGRIPNQRGIIKKKEVLEQVKDAMKAVGVEFDPEKMTGDLSVAQKQFVEIAKAVSMNARIIVMDEPTSVLTLPETEVLFQLIRKLKKQGRSIIYISHRLEELVEIADRCTVLKDGTYVGTCDMKDVTKDRLISMMTGREIKNIYPEKQKKPGKVCLKVEHLTRKGIFEDVSFSLREGEILGFSGLVGSGRSEICRTIFGIDPLDEGKVFLGETEVHFKQAKEALDAGIVYITEDRKGDGLFLKASIGDNLSISILPRLCRLGVISRMKETKVIEEYLGKLRVKCAGPAQVVGDLSGGNQQKVMIARAMMSQSKIIIVDEPTRGVDVGTKTEIYKIIQDMADHGCGVIMISSELPEVIGMSDRILVMHSGKLTGEISREEATEENILGMATGGM